MVALRQAVGRRRERFKWLIAHMCNKQEVSGLRFWMAGVVSREARYNPFGTTLTGESRRRIVEALYEMGPSTVKQVADRIGYAPSTVLRHVERMCSFGVVRKVSADHLKKYGREIFYELGFPVFTKQDHEKIDPIYQRVAREFVQVVKEHMGEFSSAFDSTSLRARGWKFDDPEIQWIFTRGGLSIGFEGALNALRDEGLIPAFPKRPGRVSWFLFGEEDLSLHIDHRKAGRTPK